MDRSRKHEKIKLVEINSYLTCYLCKGYLIDATTISECLHSFCRSCIIKFLQENCYCPVCEVIINKAKPCLKLDKTLQDIVYKLVPELFSKEMYRRKTFYQSRPNLAPKVSPEERGEDTERTIFNPQDAISLSIEYVSDDSAPGAIPMLNENQSEEPQGNPMKRYLQCPGMCRIEVLKKFVRNKYNVDTNLFHIDILYKRVPLPDHYTLIDIGYIYSWKRNEPMKFFFRITDINKVTERFDYFDGKVVPEFVHVPIPRTRNSIERKTKKSDICAEKTSQKKDVKIEAPQKISDFKSGVKCQSENENDRVKVKIEELTPVSVVKCEPRTGLKSEKNELKPVQVKFEKKPVKHEVRVNPKKTDVKVKSTKPEVKLHTKTVKKEVKIEENTQVEPENKSETKLNEDEIKVSKSEIVEEIKNKIQNGNGLKNSFYTNITLNRDKNVEIITKIQKVSNKDGHPIGLNIINHTVKKANKVQIKDVASSTKMNRVPSSISASSVTPSPSRQKEECDFEKKSQEDIEKSNFLKCIELTAKDSIIPKPPSPSKPLVLPSVSPKQGTQKRKNSSPVKNDKLKKGKVEKKPVKIIIQSKTIQNPAVRQIVTNVNQNVNSMSKIVEQTTPKATDLRSLIDNCKINIPASLSITLNEGGETSGRSAPSIKPVKNFIEILKIEDKVHLQNPQSFQKIFEESLKKEDKNENKSPLDLTNNAENNNPSPKRRILEIASQLQKKTKEEQEKNKCEENGKIAIPRFATQRTLKPKFDTATPSRPQSANMHPTGSFNPSGFGSGQLQALQHAMLLKYLEHQNWLNNQGSLMQYEKYLQTLSGQSKVMGNIKEN